jgi:hypothetical protein
VSQALPVYPPHSITAFPYLAGLSSDGSELVFSTTAQLVSQDTNQLADLYVTANGADALLDPNADTATTPATFLALTPDGRYVYLNTDAPLSPQDANGGSDIYKVAVPAPQPPSPPPPSGTPSPPPGVPSPGNPPPTGPKPPGIAQLVHAVNGLAADLRAEITRRRLADLLHGHTIQLRLARSFAGRIVITIALRRPHHTRTLLARVARTLSSPRPLRIPITIPGAKRLRTTRGLKSSLELILAITIPGHRTITATVTLR